MKHTIEKIDFDEAVKQSWDACTCIIAQSSKRQGLFTEYGAPVNLGVVAASEIAATIRTQFDRYFKHPGDETKPELVALRESLPVEIELP